REWVERRRHFRQKKSTATHEEKQREEQAAPERAIFEKVHRALRALGFRESEVFRAIQEVVTVHDAREPLDLERALRNALLVATAA
ncbi:MAG TPA: hypothetical protein VMS65_08785, partial [Polyangiaceae bacterium]|nr:hypothetical protein [Polyangiaceae bacterium]